MSEHNKGLQMTHSGHVDPLRRHCSIATLQSEPRGHFASLMDHLRTNTGNYVNVLLQVSQQKSDLELVRYVASVEGMAFYSPRPFFPGKDSAMAEKERLVGNDHFKKANYAKAFMHYSVAVVKAKYPENTEDKTLAFAVGNRSACLFQMSDYQNAAADIQLALSLGYPAESRYKLYDRLGQCYMRMNRPDKAKGAFLVCKQLLESVNGEDKRKETVNRALGMCKNTVASKEQNEDEEQLLVSHNEGFPSMSAKLRVEHNETVGRHTVANEEIHPADTVLVEEAFASVLYPQRHGLNCAHCFARLRAAVPCKRCSGMAFCSTLCRDKADDGGSHSIECEFQDVLTGLGCSQIARLALRIVSQHPKDYFLRRKEQLFNNGTSSKKDAYAQVYNLVGLEEQRWPEDLLMRAAMALVLLGILRAAGYFGEKKSTSATDTYTPNELFVASLLLRHLKVLQFNAHEVYETLRGSGTSLKPSKNIAVGLAVYPTAAYVNHSCHGGLARYFQGTKLVLKALRPFDIGHEVCDNYGPTFYLKPRGSRKKELSARYWFECQCEACRENWPLLDALPVLNVPTNQFDKATEKMNRGQVKDAIVHLKQHIIEAAAKTRPSQDLIRAEDKLRTCISNLGSVVYTDTIITVDKK